MNTFNSLDDSQLYSFLNTNTMHESFPSSLDLQSQPSSTILDLSDDQSTPQNSNLTKSSKKILKISRNPSDDAISSGSTPSRKPRNFWTPLEDEKLLQLIHVHGPKWSLIGDIIGSKSCKQVRDRYLNFLRPNINNGPFTLEEDSLLLSLYEKFGKRWKMIGDQMTGRTEVQVKNRFYRHIEKKMLGDIQSEIGGKKLKRALSADSQTTNNDFDGNLQEEKSLEINQSSTLTRMQEELVQNENQANSFEDIFYQLNFRFLNHSEDLIKLE